MLKIIPKTLVILLVRCDNLFVVEVNVVLNSKE